MGIMASFRKLFRKNKKIKTKKRKAKWNDSKEVKAARIDIGMKKIYAFIDRGIRLNPIPKRKKKSKLFLKKCHNHL